MFDKFDKIPFDAEDASPLKAGVIVNIEFRVLVELLKYGLVTTIARREDSQGRAIVEPMPAPEVVERAVEMVEFAVMQAYERGWMRPFPEAEDD